MCIFNPQKDCVEFRQYSNLISSTSTTMMNFGLGCQHIKFIEDMCMGYKRGNVFLGILVTCRSLF